MIQDLYEKDYKISTNPQQSTVEPKVNPLFKKRRVVSVNEVAAYLDTYPLADAAVDPLDWWRANSSSLPNLSRMAKDYLSIPSSSASSERSFSGSKQTITQTRTRLSGDAVQATQCLKSWLKRGGRKERST